MLQFGIDLGTANTVVFNREQGVVLNEPSVMAMQADRRRQLVAIGSEARSLAGRTSPDMAVVWPLEDGVITDLETASVTAGQ